MSKFVIVTIARLCITLGLIVSLSYSPIATGGLLFIFVASDILDGVWARKHNADDKIRRIADATTDGISILLIGLYFVWQHPQFISLFVPLLIRDLAVYAICCFVFVKNETVLVGGYWHKYASLSKAALFLSMLSGNFALASTLAFTAWIINYILLIDYFRRFLSTFKQLRSKHFVELLQ